MIHGYDTCIRYDTYLIRGYIYFERTRYMIDTRYMNIEKCVQ